MEKIVIKFDDIEIEKRKFHQHKRPISINNIDINKTVVYNKSLSVKKFLNIFLVTRCQNLQAYFLQN